MVAKFIYEFEKLTHSNKSAVESESLTRLLYALALQGKFSNTNINRLIKGYFSDEGRGYPINQLVKRLTPEAWSAANEEISRAGDEGIRVISLACPDYPKLLYQIEDPPLALFVRGDLPERIRLAVVGTRRATPYGLRFASTFSRAATTAGALIVSGMAQGIDAAAHEGALAAVEENLATDPGIAILGCGLHVTYPARHRALQDYFINSGGVVVTEYGLFQRPRKDLFPRRNRIISGLSEGTIVVEAAEKSGSLITARTALEQGRDVFALPGPVDSVVSKGTNRLVADGASIILSVESVLSFYPELSADQTAGDQDGEPKEFPALDDRQRLVLKVLAQTQNNDDNHLDLVCEKTALTPRDLRSTLTELELMGVIIRSPDGYSLKSL